MAADSLMTDFAHPHRRYNPLADEWVLVSAHRANRPWQGATQQPLEKPLAAYDADCYLCPTNKRVGGAVNPQYPATYAFANDYPALSVDVVAGGQQDPLFKAEPVTGQCRVICYSPDHSKTMAQMSVSEIDAIVCCWQEELARLGEKYCWVQLFENKGESMGCSSPHPHGQVWATSFLPVVAQKEDQSQRNWYDEHRSLLLLDTAEREIEAAERVVLITDHWLVVVPYWASWPFETLLLPRFEVARLTALTPAQREDLAAILRELTVRYDNLFQCSFPYSMGWHGAPFGTADTAHWQLHAHFYPPLLRSATVRKFMVGYEMLAEAQRDLTAEMAAQKLREVSSIHFRELS